MQHWIAKFGHAIRGWRFGASGQSSFLVHLPLAAAVVGLAILLRCSLLQWCLLLLCIAMVLSLELMNSALESLVRGLCTERRTEIGKALDMASGAVLIASLIAALVGLLIFGIQLAAYLGSS